MRGWDTRTGELFSYVDLEKRVPAKHPLRLVREVVNEVLAALDSEFAKIYADSGRPSIAPERLLRALLLQAFAFLGSVDHNAFAKVNGKTLKAVSNVVGRPNTYIMVRSDLMPVTGELSQFLKGKRIAVAPYGRTPNNMLRYILSRMHLDPKNDVTLVEVETNVVPTTVGAKQADAGASQEPFISIGYKRGVWGQPVYSAASDLGPYTDTALSVRPESIEKEPALVRSMVRAVVRGLVYANAHRDEMVALARSEYPNASADDLDASLKRAFADDIFSADGFIPLEA